MMNRTYFMFLLGIITLFSNCTPQPQACISVNKTNIRAGESLSFTSCALDAKRIVWNFGDGSETSENSTVTHTFSSAGTYLVELKVLSKKDKKWDRSTVLITVSYPTARYLTRIQINSFDPLNSSGQSWDTNPDSGPDVYIGYGVDGSESQNYTSLVNDLQLSQCPVFWDFGPQVGKPILSNQNWKLYLVDNDGNALQQAFQIMTEFSLNPATETPSEPGKIKLQNGNYQLELDFIEL
jgi:PKD repeat protein